MKILKSGCLAIMLAVCLGAGGSGFVAATPARAQTDVHRPAAVVNEEIVSNYDVDMRLNLVLSSTGAADDPEERRRMHRQILQGLVDEKLQIQEAREKEVEVTAEDVDKGITELANQNNLTRGQFEDFLLTIRSDIETIRLRVQAELMWSELVSRQLAARLFISDSEIQGVIDRMKADAGKPEYDIAEIYLTIDSPEKEDEVRRAAIRLISQLRNKVPFPTVARQFSQSATAASGGNVGWVPESQLAPEIAEVLRNMIPGRVSPPIRTVGGFNIILLKDRRKVLTVDPMQVTLNLKQIMFDLSPDALPEEINALKQVVEEGAQAITKCEDVERIGKELGAASAGPLGSLKQGELPPAISNAVDSLEIGHASRVLMGGNSLRLFVVCDRDQPEVTLPSFDFIEQRLTNQRLSLMARRYMRDLRRDAIVDYK